MEAGGRSNGTENTCYRQATLFCRLVRGEGGMKQRRWIVERGKREKCVEKERERENEKLTGTFCRLFNKIPKRFDRRQKK